MSRRNARDSRRGGNGGGGAAAFDPALYGTVDFWTRGDDVTLNGSDIASWNDKSGNARHWAQGTAAVQPAQAVAALNGRDGIRFTGAAGEFLTGPDLLTLGRTSAEIFIVAKKVADPAASDPLSGFWETSNSVAGAVPFTDGAIYDGFGSSARKTLPNPTSNLANGFVWNIITASGEWTSSINGALSGNDYYTTAVNTVDWLAAPRVGRDKNASARCLDGWLFEMLCYSAKLATPASRAAVNTALKAYYGIT
ncbi:MAG: hypothetical protein WC211_00905 [Dehalococcoidia bacterium]